MKLQQINRPLVSVCVITYQHSNFISQCLDNILNQETDFPFEIIVGEDESSDGTREICLSYAKRFPQKIRLFLRSRKDIIVINGRPTGRYNFIECLKAAKGKYITICEGDDYWNDSFKLQKQFDFLHRNEEYVLSFHDCKIISESGNTIRQSQLLNRANDISQQELLTGAFLPTRTVMFRNNLIDEFPPEFYKVEKADVFLFALLGQFGKAKFQGDISPATYRMHPGGVWSPLSLKDKMKGRINTYECLVKIIQHPFKKVAKAKLSQIYHVMFIECLKEGNLLHAIKFWMHSIKSLVNSSRPITEFLLFHLASYRRKILNSNF